MNNQDRYQGVGFRCELARVKALGYRSSVTLGVFYGGLALPKKRFTWIVLGFAALKPTYPKNEQAEC